jgi:uncharacterized protein YukE
MPMIGFVPPEAVNISSQLWDVSNHAHQIAGELRALSDGLDATWRGNAAQTFLQNFRPLAHTVESAANEVANAAQRIRQINIQRPE